MPKAGPTPLRLLGAFCAVTLASANPAPELLSPDPELLRAGDEAAAALSSRLSSALVAAMADGGPLAAIHLCHDQALPLTTGPLEGFPNVLALKRTSLRLRNPANAPDAAEQQALAHADALLAKGEKPMTFAQRVPASANHPEELRVYRPIHVQPACLTCHGSMDTQPAPLRAALAQRYPADAAHGYRNGEWRGLVRVTLTQPAAENAATHASPQTGQ